MSHYHLRQVDLVGIIFESLASGIEPDVELLAEAEDHEVNVEAIRKQVEDLFGDDYDAEAELDFS